VNVRVIAATNADLEARIQSGAFRNDLYFRLARYSLATPALRERMEDVAMLAHHFLQVFAAEMGIALPSFSPGALQVLSGYHFPGNVRELRNLVERALIESGGKAIQPDHLHLLARAVPEPAPSKSSITHSESISELPLNLADAEDILIQRALRETDGNIADAARLLGVHRTRIYRKLALQDPVPE
jgi:DNA-binding NtrC family response regulator